METNLKEQTREIINEYKDLMNFAQNYMLDLIKEQGGIEVDETTAPALILYTKMLKLTDKSMNLMVTQAEVLDNLLNYTIKTSELHGQIKELLEESNRKLEALNK